MPLVTCPDCSAEISDAAPTCPRCGRAAPTRWWVRVLRIVGLTIIGMAILWAVFAMAR